MTARPFVPRPAEDDIRALYERGRYSVRDTAEILKVSKDCLFRAMAEYGIPRRPRTTKRALLADIPVELLEANVRAEGLKPHARRLGVDPATLRDHIRRSRHPKNGGV